MTNVPPYFLLACLFVWVSLEFRCAKGTPTPPLPGSVTQTLSVDPSILLNPTATYYSPSSSVYVTINTGCGGNLTNHSGQLTHPEYPKPIAIPSTCTWRVNLDTGMRVSLLYNYLDLKGQCSENFLEIWEKSSGGSRTLLRRSCGYLDKPERLVTKTNSIDVVFNSNSSISGGGFLVTYSVFKGCNQTFANNSGVIQSPYYPNDYPLNIQCAYTITAPADHQVSLSLEFLDLAYSMNCTDSVLEVWDGPVGISSPVGRYCGYLISQWLRSKSNVLSLRFSSSMVGSRRGYKLRYYAVKSDCNSTMNSTEGFISAPSENGPCSWTINSIQGHVISLRFDRFFLSLSENCSRDYLVIKDGRSVIGRYCGYQKGELVYSNDNSVTLEYFTSKVDGHGFQIYYKTFIKPDSYNYLNMSRGYLQTPLYPDNYPSNTKYDWLIEQPIGYIIDLAFDDFELEFSVNCTKDYVEIFDGANNSSVSLGKYCGTKKTSDHVTTSGNMMYLEFVSNSQRPAKGFKISYTGIRIDCPKNFTNSSGTIMSPNYPDFYPKNYHCEWHISYMVGYQIYLTLSYFDVAPTDACIGDYVVFRGLAENKDDSPERHCGYLVKRYPLVSKYNTMMVAFHTDGVEENRGFVLNYKVDGTGYPTPPRSPTSNELEQAVVMELYNITKSKWITNKDLAFKNLVANATNIFCDGENVPSCFLLTKERQRRSLDSKFTAQSIHLAPGYPKARDSVLVVVLYALYSSDMRVDTDWTSSAIPKNALKRAILVSKEYIESSFGTKIKSISYYVDMNSTSATPVVPAGQQSNILPIVLGVIGGFVLLFAVILSTCLCWRKKNHGRFMVKRCVTPIEFVDENDEIKLEKVKSGEPQPARRRASTLKVVDLDSLTD